MENLRLVPDDTDDLYSGFNEFPSALFNTKDLEQDEFLQQALRSSYGKRTGAVSTKYCKFSHSSTLPILFYFLKHLAQLFLCIGYTDLVLKGIIRLSVF